MSQYPTRGIYIAMKCKAWADENIKTKKYPKKTVTLVDGEDIHFEEDENSLEFYTESNCGVKQNQGKYRDHLRVFLDSLIPKDFKFKYIRSDYSTRELRKFNLENSPRYLQKFKKAHEIQGVYEDHQLNKKLVEKQQKINKSLIDELNTEEDKAYRDKVWTLTIDEFY